MSELVRPIAEWAAAMLEVLGILIIAVFAIYALILWVIRLLKREKSKPILRQVRQTLGQGISLGL